MITTERHEVTIIRGGRAERECGYCASCAGHVELVSFDSAICVTGAGFRDFARQLEAGEIHTVETATGQFRVCRRSLEKEK